MKKTGWRLAGGLFRPAAWENKFKIFCGVTPRGAGNMRSAAALGRVLKKAGFAARAWAGGQQVHATRVRAARRPTAPGAAPATDGFITGRPGVVLRILAADCVPVFAVDPVRRVLGAFHAGWRGTHKGILPRGLGLMKKRHGSRAKNIWVTFGPHIQDCCYEVGPDVAARFQNVTGAVRKKGKSLRLSLARCLAFQARQAGVPARQILNAPFCTAHDKRFYSFRRSKTDSRMAAVAALRDGL